MIRVGVSGANGRMGRAVATSVEEADGLELAGLYDPTGGAVPVAGLGVSAEPDALAGCEVVVEFTEPDVVMANLARWRSSGSHVVVGTSGFSSERLEEVAELWGSGPPNCLIAPNFSIGAVLMMRFAELAARSQSRCSQRHGHQHSRTDWPCPTRSAPSG